jgi:predicted transcriptional regulator
VAICIDYHFAWSHGDIQEDIANTWVGFVGPGIRQGGIDGNTWTDHTNVRPTILTLLGQKDDYVQDGRVLIEGLTTQATPHSLIAHRETVRRLGAVYEQLNAPFGSFGESIASASTKALASTDQARYELIETAIAGLTARRDALAHQIRDGLNAAAFDGRSLNQLQAMGWIVQSQALIALAKALGSV